MAQNDLHLENYSDLIWSVADMLRGSFQEDDYGAIILPFALLRRIECALAPTREIVVQKYEVMRNAGMVLESHYSDVLKKESEAPFFNTTKITLNTIGASNTRSDMQAYLDGFSRNIREIFDKMNFKNICDQLESADHLYDTIQHFKNLDLSPATVPTRVMSNIYEELIWRFAATKHKQSKEFLTPRDVVRLATTLVLETDNGLLTSDNGQIRTVYDPTCGSCGFISDAIELIQEYADQSGAKYPPMLIPSGQEIAPVSWAIGKAMMLLQSMSDNQGDSNAIPVDKSIGIVLGNTLTDDKHADETFDYVFSNPPFGMDWTKEYSTVLKDVRFATVGLPPKSDGSMLFLTHVAKKIAENGKGAIVLSGSPLFTGGAGSGSSNIRRWLFESDIVEAIVQLPGSLFYNTSIQTYLWLLNKAKPSYKKNKVQLINASEFKTLIRNVGSKRYIIADKDIEAIAREVANYKDSGISKICDYQDFGYRTVTIQRPLRVKCVISDANISALLSHKALNKVSDADRNKIRNELEMSLDVEKPFSWIDSTLSTLKKQGVKLGTPVRKAFLETLTVEDPEGEVAKDAKGSVITNPSAKQVENIPLDEDIESYVEHEVLPFVPDAFVDSTVVDTQDKARGIVGYEVNFNKYFYKYVPPRDPEEIAKEIQTLEAETNLLMKELFQ